MATSLSAEAAVRLDDLVARACERAGLDDFGGDSWREGLRSAGRDVRVRARRQPGGREFVYGQFVDALWNRLRVVDYCKRHPEVATSRFERPLVVLGLPRTGTSLASYLLDQDPLRRSLLTWEAEDSVPPSTPDTLYTDPRCLKKKAELDVLAEGPQGGQHPAGALGRGRRSDRVHVRAEPGLQGLSVGGVHALHGVRRLATADRHDERLRVRATGAADASVPGARASGH